MASYNLASPELWLVREEIRTCWHHSKGIQTCCLGLLLHVDFPHSFSSVNCRPWLALRAMRAISTFFWLQILIKWRKKWLASTGAHEKIFRGSLGFGLVRWLASGGGSLLGLMGTWGHGAGWRAHLTSSAATTLLCLSPPHNWEIVDRLTDGPADAKRHRPKL